jgi:hypothetical protein
MLTSRHVYPTSFLGTILLRFIPRAAITLLRAEDDAGFLKVPGSCLSKPNVPDETYNTPFDCAPGTAAVKIS